MVTVRWVGPDKGPWHKFERAGYHLDSLKEATSAFGKRHRNSFRVAKDAETGDLVYYAVLVEQPPRDVGLILGDFVHCAKASLDHALCAILPCVPSDTRTEYPIFKDRDEFGKRGYRKIKNLPLKPKKIVLRAQPYRIGLGGGDPLSDALWLLHELERTDKHRELLVAVAAQRPELVEITPKSPQYQDSKIKWRILALNDGEEILRIPAAAQAEADFEPRFSYPVVTARVGPVGARPLVNLATDIYNRVRFELNQLDPFIP